MAEGSDDPRILTLWAAALAPRVPEPGARARMLAALDAEPHLPFCGELARCFALPEQSMRALLARIVDPAVWTRGSAPVGAFFDFQPGPALAPLRGGFVRLLSGARLARHRHTDRELTYVLEGEMVDGEQLRYGPGSVVDMPAGSIHSLGVPEGGSALIALLHGRIELLPA